MKPSSTDHLPNNPATRNCIKTAPAGTPEIDRYRAEAEKRIRDWLDSGKTPEQIAYDGYRWRSLAHENGGG